MPTQALINWWQSHNKPHDDASCVCLQGGWCSTIESLARKLRTRGLKVSHSTIFRRIREGKLTVDEADEWANKIGAHPSWIWTNWDRLRACGGRCHGHANRVDDDRRQAITAALGTGRTQADVAREFGVSPRTVSAIAQRRRR